MKYCENCVEEIEDGAKYCANCGESVQKFNENELAGVDSVETISEDKIDVGYSYETNSNTVIQTSRTKKLFKGIGLGGLAVGGGILFLFLTVVRFLYIASAGLSMVLLAISFFHSGSIFWGLVVLLIGTPIAIGIASYLFLPLLILSVITLIVWGIISIFGFNVSFDSVWSGIWFLIKVLIIGGMAFFGISGLVSDVKHKRTTFFFKENWFYILLFFFLISMFF